MGMICITGLLESPILMQYQEFLAVCMENMSSSDWEVNVKGMTGVLRLVRHHTDFVVVEYKDVVHHIMRHVKNLRSQVSEHIHVF